MAVRPFYLDADIEGYKTKLKGGTKRGKGSQTINIYQRDEGDITVPFVINQFSEYKDGVHYLVTSVKYKGEEIKRHVTKY